MNSTLLYVSNPSRVRKLGLQLCQAVGADPAKTLVLCSGGGPVKFRFPRGRHISDYPLVTPVQYTFNSNTLWQSFKGTALLAGLTAAVLMSTDEVAKALSSAQHVAYVGDPYGSDIHDFRQLLELCPAAGERTVRFGYLPELSEEAAAIAFVDTAESRMAKLEQFGITKRYFEWNWLVNAQAVLTQALSAVGASTEKASLSKFGLQALYWLHTNRPTRPEQLPHTEAQLVRAFESWTGTGKYEKQSMGSPTSYRGIIEQLRDLELIEYVSQKRRIQVSEKGRAFLAKLHPGCEDADLPARLSMWGKQGIAASKGPIDRYIRTFFGRQLRFSTQSDIS